MPSDSGDLLLTDEAITSEADDEFGHKEYVDGLERILRNANPPWHIGIFGEWGSGKTSIIRMLFNRLRTKNEFENAVFVEFDAWSHAEGSIRTELLLELDERIGKEAGEDNSDSVLGEDEITGRLYDIQEEKQTTKPTGLVENLTEFWKDSPLLAISFVTIAGIALGLGYFGYSTVSSVMVTGLLLPVLGYILRQLDTVAQTIQRKFLHPRKEWSGSYQRIFEDIIETSNANTVVISIDNLDRCESATVYDVLVSLKTFLENEKCIYLIPCDDTALESHIKSIDESDYFDVKKNEREFLRKFFQTHIRIPPFLPESIEEYIEKENQKLSDEFEEEALDVLTNAYIDNPRRIKHALNRLSTLRVLAEGIEQSGDLTRGRITDHIPFLAKLSIIEEEYPNFHKTLSKNPRVLGEINEYFRDQISESSERDRIETILSPTSDPDTSDEQESRLEAFLRSTRRIHVENLKPFLNLSEPSYATELTNVDAFLQNLRTGQKEDVRKELEQVQDYGPYVDAIDTTFDEYARKRRSQPLFGSIDTTIAVFEEFDDRSQGRLLQLLGEYLTFDLGRGFLVDLDPKVTLPIVIQMRDSDSRELLEEYAHLVVANKELRENILQAFVDNTKTIPHSIAQIVSKRIASLDDKGVVRALTTIEASPEAKDTFANLAVLKRAISIIQLDESNNEFIDVTCYTDFEDVASKKSRGIYITHLLDLRQSYSSNQDQRVDENLSNLLLGVNGGLLASDAERLFSNIREFVEARFDQEPIHLVEVCFHYYNSFPKKTTQSFHNWLAELFQDWNTNNIEKLFDFSEEYDVPVLETEAEVDAALQRIPNPVNGHLLVKEKIVSAIPTRFNEQLCEKTKNLIRNNNNNHSQLGREIFIENSDRFEPFWGEIIELCGDIASRQRNPQQKKPYLEVGAQIYSKMEGPEQENYMSQISDLLNGNRNGYQLYRDLWNEIAMDVGSDRKEIIANDVSDELIQAFNRNQNPGQLGPLIDVLSSISRHLSDEEGRQFMDRISKQLTDNQVNVNQKAQVLNHLSEFDRLFGKEDQILDRVEDLVKRSNHNNVNQNAEELLESIGKVSEVNQARINQIQEDHLSS